MISTRKLFRMARKWQRNAVIGRKRVTFQENSVNDGITTSSSSSPVAEKGHVVVYTVDQKRHSFPIAYLNNYIFRELLTMAEEEFGLPSDGHITIPCEADLMDYLICVIQRGATAPEVEKALLLSIADYRCSSSCMVDDLEISRHSLVYCF